MLRIYTRTVLGDKEIENEVEVDETYSHSQRIEIIKLVLGLEEEE